MSKPETRRISPGASAGPVNFLIAAACVIAIIAARLGGHHLRLFPSSLRVALPLAIAGGILTAIWTWCAKGAQKAGQEELASAAFGLAFGGMAWGIAAVMTLPGTEAAAVEWLRHHAWDYLGAGAAAAVTWHLLENATAKSRLSVMRLVAYLAAAITSFTADNSNYFTVAFVTLACEAFMAVAIVPLYKVIDPGFSVKGIYARPLAAPDNGRMNDEPIPAADVDEWARHIAAMNDTAIRDPEDDAAAGRAVAMMWSGYGWQSAPFDVQRLLVQAVETGYCMALGDVRDGQLDDDIRMWRPGIAGD
jgi:hypothetical protein